MPPSAHTNQSIRIIRLYAIFATIFLVGCALLFPHTGYRLLFEPNQPAWGEWQSPEVREFCTAIRSSDLDEVNKALLTKLAYSKRAWDSGLIKRLVEPLTLKRIVWQGQFRDDLGALNRVFVLDSFVRPCAGAPIPPVCIITDWNYNLLAWKTVAGYSTGFVSAKLSRGESPVLTLTVLANWYRGRGQYRYSLSGRKITELGMPVWGPAADTDQPRPFENDPNRLKRALEDVRLFLA